MQSLATPKRSGQRLLWRLLRIGLALTLLWHPNSPGLEAAPPEVVAWIREHAIAFRTVEPEHGFDDMQTMKKVVRDARIVALGEATHGTREFFRFKHRMFEFLASEMGFTIFAMEANWPESLAINDYVVNNRGDPAQALAAMPPGVWNTEEVLELIRWMRRYNADSRHARKLQFAGFDMQAPALAAERTLDYLRRVDPESVESATRLLAPFRRADFMNFYPKRGADYRRWVANGLDKLLLRLIENKPLFVSRSSEADWSLTAHHARLVWQAERCRREPPTKSPRDRFMAENIRWLLDQGGKDARMMVWAHNGHICLDPETYPYRPMGADLKAAYGPAYLALGFAFKQGSFRAKPWSRIREVWSRGSEPFVVGPAPAESVDGILGEAGMPLFVLDLRLLPPGGPTRSWWDDSHLTRSFGAVYADRKEGGGFVRLIPRNQYDGWIFIETTTPSRPNPISSGLARRPETVSGVD